MPVSAKRRQEVASGTVRWEHDCPETGNPVLRISVARANGEVVSQDYEVERVDTTPPWVDGYNLYRLDCKFHLVTYHIRIDEVGVWWCDCPDSDMDPVRCNSCKHVRGLRKALDSRPF